MLQYEFNILKQIEETNLKETDYFYIGASPVDLEDHLGAVVDHPGAV